MSSSFYCLLLIKPNTKKDPDQPKKARKKRDPQHNGVRRLDPNPAEIIIKQPEKCPACHNRLGGLSLSHKRQVLELPEPAPIWVTEYHLYKGWCANCQRWHEVELDLSQQALGQGRFGLRIVSLIGYLRQTLRLPIRLIQQYLAVWHGLAISVGEIVEILHRLTTKLHGSYQELKQTAQASPIKYVDETTWWEGGQNGYIWSMTSSREAWEISFEEPLYLISNLAQPGLALDCYKQRYRIER